MAVTFAPGGAVANPSGYPPTPTTAAVTTATWAYPSGIAAGDALILAAANNNPNGGSGGSGTTFTTPSGWTAQESAPGINTDGSGYLFTKTAAGTESGTNLSLTMSSSGLIAAYILHYTGNNTTSPFGGKSLATSASAQNGSPTHGTVSPAPGASDLVVRMYAFGQDSASTGETLSSPGGSWVTRGKSITNVSSAFQCGICVADELDGLDNQTVTVTSGHSAGWIVAEIVIAVAPAAAAASRLYSQAVARAAFR